MAKFIANSMHIPPHHPSIRLDVGDSVYVGDHDRVWPKYVFVLAEGGVGWVPHAHLSSERPTATVLIPFDTRELAVHAGAMVEMDEWNDHHGWAWCRGGDGSEGWVPLSCLDPASHP
ncbi:SH3-like domain-containing protein [Microbacterium phyllosphaerae]|uniref:SH3-like domain-containing protein n=1 Tax=Microbacterium phyllosphaerae TaxID=124798 RepID=A0ABS4WL28_9MICO|nr:hypothetical protein [Microbacterium phyllosphaerae]MBP2376910.1 SH3-like domain-containing protein [Microbacterium phyllosphaerae]